MRSRVIAGCAVAALGLGVQAAAATAKPVLWVKDIAEERAPSGRAATVHTYFDSNCEVSQEAHLQANGKTSDKLTLGAPAGGMECEGEKVAGGLTGLALKPAGPSGSGAMTITMKDDVHILLAATWCVYALPKAVSLPGAGESQSSAYVAAALVKSASFGTCASSRQVEVFTQVEDDTYISPFLAEVV